MMSNQAAAQPTTARSAQLEDRWSAVSLERMPAISRSGVIAWIHESAGQDRLSDPPTLRVRRGKEDEIIHVGTVSALTWDGSRLIYAVSDGATSVVMSWVSGEFELLGEHLGAIEQLECRDGIVYALVAPPGTDGPVGTGAIRSSPTASRSPTRALARSVFIVGHDRWESLPVPGTVWEFALGKDGGVVCVRSDDPTESGWYSSTLVALDSSGQMRTLLTSPWQLSRPRISPDGRNLLILEGWASDRDMLAGVPLLLSLHGGSKPVALPVEDVTAIAWRDADSIWICRWEGVDGVVAAISIDGEVTERFHAGAECIHSAAFPPPGASDVPAAVISDGEGRRVDRLRPGVPPAATENPCWRAIQWTANDGRVIQGMLALPANADGTVPLVLHVHGGPANLWTTHRDLPVTLLTEAGYAVLRANPRGSVGRGSEFARANLGDPAGEELGDLTAGIDALVAQGIADPLRVAAMGGSYGGYLTSALATFTDRLCCAVVLCGHPDLVSARYGANNTAFYDALLGGSPGAMTWGTYLARSPVFHVTSAAAPTLIVHGGADRCTPVGQAEELARALSDAEIEHRLVVYPDEGHGIRSRAALGDYWRNVLTWLDRYFYPNS